MPRGPKYVLTSDGQGPHEYAAAYLDDIAIFGKSWENHLTHIRDVFSKLAAAGLTVKKNKCQSAMAECPFLGHVVGKGTVKSETGKIKAAQNFSVPKTKKDV